MNFIKVVAGLLYFGCLAVRGQENRCDPGVCTSPGLVFNEEMNQCSWADEVGCNVKGNITLKTLHYTVFISHNDPTDLGFLAFTWGATSPGGSTGPHMNGI